LHREIHAHVPTLLQPLTAGQVSPLLPQATTAVVHDTGCAPRRGNGVSDELRRADRQPVAAFPLTGQVGRRRTHAGRPRTSSKGSSGRTSASDLLPFNRTTSDHKRERCTSSRNRRHSTPVPPAWGSRTQYS
jgi:hypothetical protein